MFPGEDNEIEDLRFEHQDRLMSCDEPDLLHEKDLAKIRPMDIFKAELGDLLHIFNVD